MKADYVKPSVYNVAFRYMQYDNALCLRLCLETGLRVGDALKVRAEDINGRTLTYTAEKTGKTGKKVLSPNLVRELLRNAGGGGYCFKGRLDPNKHRTREAVWKDLLNACKRAGLKGHISPHSTRKTYAVDVYEREGIAAAQQELQHDNMTATMLYAFSNVLNGSEAGDSVGQGLDMAEVENAAYRGCERALRALLGKSE